MQRVNATVWTVEMIAYKYMTLDDGRQLSYLEYGDPNGYPVFYFHGTRSSCIEPLMIGNELFEKHQLRIISTNRPGIGPSSLQKGRTFMHWPHDVVALANYLNIHKFAVLGNSGGAAYVLACAAKIPERISAAAIVSGGWQMNIATAKKYLKFPNSIFWSIASKLPFLLPLLLASMKSIADETEEKLQLQFKKLMTPANFETLARNKKAKIVALTITESLLNKKGAAIDVLLYVKDPGIDFGRIKLPLSFFHGNEDKNVSIELAKEMIAVIPNSTLIVYDGEAHLSTLCNHFDDVAKEIISTIS